MKKRNILMTLVMALVLFLAACSNGGSEESSTDSNDSGSETTETSGETVEVTFWHAMNGPLQEAITALVEDFNASQDQYVVVEQNQGDYDTLNQSIIASGGSGDLPTMSQLTPGDVPDMAQQGMLAELDDILVSDNGFTQEQIDDIYPGFMSSSQYNGTTYAVPFSKSTRIMFYNQDILDEYGVEVAETWEDVIALGEMMVEAGDDRVAMGLENSYEMEFETMARQSGSTWISEDLSEVAINDEQATTALNFIMDNIDAGYMRTAGEDGFFSGPFANGESAYYIGSSAGVSYVAEPAEEAGTNWGTAEIPVFGGGEELTLFAGNDLGIFSTASEEEQQGAVAFMAFLLQPENTAYWAINSGYLPITQAGTESEEYQAYLEENPTAQAAANSLPYGMSSPIFVGHGEYRNNLLATLEDVLVNDAPVEESLTSLDESTEAIISDNN